MSHLHDYKIVQETKNGIIEVCRQCKHKLKTKKGFNEKINNKKYLKEHRRDFLQPWGETAKDFKKEYGEPNWDYKKHDNS